MTEKPIEKPEWHVHLTYFLDKKYGKSKLARRLNVSYMSIRNWTKRLNEPHSTNQSSLKALYRAEKRREVV